MLMIKDGLPYGKHYRVSLPKCPFKWVIKHINGRDNFFTVGVKKKLEQKIYLALA